MTGIEMESGEAGQNTSRVTAYAKQHHAVLNHLGGRGDGIPSLCTPRPEDDVEQMERILLHTMKMVANLRETQKDLAVVAGTAESRDGLISAVANSQGDITRIHINPRLMRLAHTDIAEKLTTVLQQAQLNAEAQAKQIIDRRLADTANPPLLLDERFISERVEQIARNLF
ncbi:YbaB/EbfC family DNA-binding protein [Nonomuraea mesophila]|uniref:YbaB/EbfC family DNA-binding protein n=1 Tax=Nonomuraea mesophila TaxID=2530382 RepID=A0A4R5F7J6_9ACTN|nr:YbaB/EbfC family nucleoid-associated protein [Nonomuraea mesophila]TDE44115.1 YbaB/EbfC family DNA-binding protein [Nonomuraea mesophila]